VVERICKSSGDEYLWVIRPNRSLSVRQAIRIYALITVVCLGIAVFYALHGYWPVLPFAGLEVLVLGVAFYLTLRRSGVREVVFVGREVVRVEKGREQPQESWECPRAWAQVRLLRPHITWYPSHLAILFQGRQVEIGSFLNEVERQELAYELQQVIRAPV
jgi:uncharacterized membrane protein